MKILVDYRFWDHPKTIRFASMLGRNPTEGGGYLVRLWGWTAEYRTGGSLVGLEEREVCSAAGWLGKPSRFMDAATACGWLVNGQVNDWHEHQGKYVERILADRARKRRGRSADVPRTNTPPLSLSVSGSGSVSVSRSLSPPISPPRGGARAGTFDQFWTAYPRKVGKAAASRAWDRAHPDLPAVLKALAWQKASELWTTEGGRFIPNPATWINQGRWEDEPTKLTKAAPDHPSFTKPSPYCQCGFLAKNCPTHKDDV